MVLCYPCGPVGHSTESFERGGGRFQNENREGRSVGAHNVLTCLGRGSSKTLASDDEDGRWPEGGTHLEGAVRSLGVLFESGAQILSE